MKKIKMHMAPWVTMKDKSFLNCEIRLVYQWTRVKGEKIDEMGIIVVQPKTPDDAHPFSKTVKLAELNFVSFR
jgi:hypothetical protein